MQKIIEYEILQSDNAAALARAVNQFIDRGFQLYGTLDHIYIDGKSTGWLSNEPDIVMLIQAMVKYE